MITLRSRFQKLPYQNSEEIIVVRAQYILKIFANLPQAHPRPQNLKPVISGQNDLPEQVTLFSQTRYLFFSMELLKRAISSGCKNMSSRIYYLKDLILNNKVL